MQLHRETAGVRWRLISRNGRVIAISPTFYDTSDAARAALERVQELAGSARLQPVVTHPLASFAWLWSALDEDGVEVSRGLRTYERYGTCLGAYRRFVALVARLDALGEDAPAT